MPFAFQQFVRMTGTEKAEDVAGADIITKAVTAEAEGDAVGAAVEGGNSSEASLSMVAQFDQLARNQRVLIAAKAEEMFLECVAGGGSLRRAEGAEKEGARLALELDHSAEQAGDLGARLEATRRALQEETDLRRKMEREREQLSHRFEEVRRLVVAGEVAGPQTPLREKMVRILGGRGALLPTPPGVSPSGPGPRDRSSWSPPRLLDRRLGDQGSGGRRRSRSSGHGEGRARGGYMVDIDAGHLLEQTTVLSGIKCGRCGGWLRVGKAMVRCSSCRLALHPACTSLPTACPARRP
jgi:hypothetical protein